MIRIEDDDGADHRQRIASKRQHDAVKAADIGL
jgi:hypothetical protein